MTLKTLTTLVHSDCPDRDALELSIDMARRNGAHLSVLIAGLNVIDPGFYYAGLAMATVSDALYSAEQKARALKGELDTRMADAGISWDQATAVVLAAGLGQALAERARFSDLTILPRPSGPGRVQADIVALESALLDSGTPVLIVPPAMTTLPPAKRILLAWDGGQPALRAARSALPLLTAAEEVVVSIIDPPTRHDNDSEPGSALVAWLTRHGVNVRVDLRPGGGKRISDLLEAQAGDIAADLIVMGGYGHSRTRQYVLGGTTRRMLENAPVPLFMAH